MLGLTAVEAAHAVSAKGNPISMKSLLLKGTRLSCDTGAAARHGIYAGQRRGMDRSELGLEGPFSSVITPAFSCGLNGYPGESRFGSFRHAFPVTTARPPARQPNSALSAPSRPFCKTRAPITLASRSWPMIHASPRTASAPPGPCPTASPPRPVSAPARADAPACRRAPAAMAAG